MYFRKLCEIFAWDNTVRDNRKRMQCLTLHHHIGACHNCPCLFRKNPQDVIWNQCAMSLGTSDWTGPGTRAFDAGGMATGRSDGMLFHGGRFTVVQHRTS
ncbi:unnamed protein product [Durusdinium trenchii]|uniref:Uncharacterized protein n=2 Tax=Durusdinium trenchii TaxID=1381693 RepID=A0ABP0MXP0_9DINO